MNNEIKEILAILEGRKKMYLHQQKNNSPFNDEEYIAYMILDYITNLQQEKEDYKSRCEKAVEFIKNTPLYEITYDYNMEDELEIQNVSDETASNKLLNILDGKE